MQPERLKGITFGYGFDQPLGQKDIPLEDCNQDLSTSSWPPRLRSLNVDGDFNHPMYKTRLPENLEELLISFTFNRTIKNEHGVSTETQAIEVWLLIQPAGRRHFVPRYSGVVRFQYIDLIPPPQPIERVRWPVKLNRLMFTSAHFNQPVEDSDWPPGLTHLCFRSDAFNQPIEGDSWPRGPNVPHLGEVIEQDVKNASWSPKVARIYFGDRLNKPVEGGHGI